MRIILFMPIFLITSISIMISCDNPYVLKSRPKILSLNSRGFNVLAPLKVSLLGFHPLFISYGTPTVSSSSNKIGGRALGGYCSDPQGNFWVFSGYGLDSLRSTGYLNDLFKFDGRNWTFVKGSRVINSKATYGTQGVASLSNNPSGRSSSNLVSDSNGNLWSFGGKGLDQYGELGALNDLWMFNGTNWLFLSGSKSKDQASTTTQPGGRYAASTWIDRNGYFWLMGGTDASGNTLNDLWRYANGAWSKIISGSSEIPSARYAPSQALIKYDDLYLFGGYGVDGSSEEGYLSDLFKFDSSSSSWDFISGSMSANQSAVYGEKGSGESSNSPGGRAYFSSCSDAEYSYWTFGGKNSFGFFSDLWKYDHNNWTWMAGNNTYNSSGIYGDIETTSSSYYPGARIASHLWCDSHGYVWVFGGNGYDYKGNLGLLNDLNVFNGTAWSWRSGSKEANEVIIESSSTTPPLPRYGAAIFLDIYNNAWIFGGAYSNMSFNDLWKYDGTNWISSYTSNSNESGVYQGSSARPGGRSQMAYWDGLGNSANYIFGGEGYDQSGTFGKLNDFWSHDGVSWHFIAGGESANQKGSYGELNVGSSSNVPGARSQAVTWIDQNGTLWLFGGEGYDKSGNLGLLNDLWKYENKQWVWVKGSDEINQKGNYQANIPGARKKAIAWYNPHNGSLYLFGGEGYNGQSLGKLNDLFKLDLNSGQWSFISGLQGVNQSGIYGEQRSLSFSNIPGGRSGATVQVDSLGRVWLFGGAGYDQAGRLGFLNDLWLFFENRWVWMGGSKYISQSLEDFPSARSQSVSWMGADHNFRIFGGKWIDGQNDLWMFHTSEF